MFCLGILSYTDGPSLTFKKDQGQLWIGRVRIMVAVTFSVLIVVSWILLRVLPTNHRA